MRPLSEMPIETAASIRVVFTDIDDTLTIDGQLPAVSYAALDALKQAGFAVAPVTGRPAGWCDMIARFWPVNGVIGENGAMYFAYNPESRRMRREYAASAEERAANRARLERVRERVLSEVPGCSISVDQPYREADLAVDFCEDVPPLPPDDVARIKAIFEEEGAVAKVSSIHVNGWFGEYDKLSMTQRFAAEVLGFDIDSKCEQAIFCGDSPNDAPMFAHFPNACGVANIRDFAGQIEAEPAWISQYRGGEGFAEIARLLLSARGNEQKRKYA